MERHELDCADSSGPDRCRLEFPGGCVLLVEHRVRCGWSVQRRHYHQAICRDLERDLVDRAGDSQSSRRDEYQAASDLLHLQHGLHGGGELRSERHWLDAGDAVERHCLDHPVDAEPDRCEIQHAEGSVLRLEHRMHGGGLVRKQLRRMADAGYGLEWLYLDAAIHCNRGWRALKRFLHVFHCVYGRWWEIGSAMEGARGTVERHLMDHPGNSAAK